MKREIKFRAWDKRNKKMLKVAGVELISGREIVSVGTLLPDEVVYGKVNGSNLSLMQFTGLHDKNGREIYESDIVRVSADGQSYVSIVIGPDSDYPAFDLDSKYIPDPWYYDANVLSTIATGEFEEMEVIGNVHQNPELFEVEVHDAG